MKIAVLFATLSASLVYAAQPSWVDKLTNQTNNVCCFNYDGQRLEDPDWDTNKTAEYPYKVKREGAWVEVPDWAVVTMKNQDGIARVWWNVASDDTGNFVRCFLPGSLS